jgi:two-component system, NtrC family, sensor histidine kinase HupT/HoxJ
MQQINEIAFVLLHISTFLTFILLIFILRLKNKKTLHLISFGADLVIFLWCAFSLAEQYSSKNYHYGGMVFTNLVFSTIVFVSVYIFLLGYSYSHEDLGINKKLYLLFIVPIICVVLIWTNDYHHLYFIQYSQVNSEFKKGIILQLMPFFSYPMILLGLYYLIKFSIRNSGFFSRQSALLIIGTIVPVTVDVAYVIKIYSFPLYFEPISFSIAIVFFMISIFRFGFLSIVPIALQTVVDHISDSYLVVNVRNMIIDFNKPFFDSFKDIASVKRRDSLEVLLNKLDNVSFVKYDGFMESIKEAIEKKKSVSFENQYTSSNLEKTFTVEITPIFSESIYKGVVILLKDITEQRKSFEMIRQTQVMLIESEHMASLGQLVGGIAHNLKTPIMSISGGLVGLSDLVDEYEEAVGDTSVTIDDHHEIAADMRVWIGKMKEYTAYMSDIITTVKGQAVQLNASTTDSFSLKELIKRVDILMNHELKRYGCRLNIQRSIDLDVEVKGDINSLVQVINNLIINSIEAYEGKEGVIEFIISMNEQLIEFEVKDYGSGMTDETKNKLFKEMITTKAKNGTGLGLYMSYSTITGRFGGKMWFESVYGMGTSFYIIIPAVQMGDAV